MVGEEKSWSERINGIWDQFVPESLFSQPASYRRARLQIQFGFLGSFFAGLYASFYFLIDHPVGAWLIFACSMMILALPALLKYRKDLCLTGNCYGAILVTGFTGLCMIEGGMAGHALAWLATIPLFVFLLVAGRPAVWWAVVAVLIATAFGILHLQGVKFPKLYPEEHAGLVDFAGYTGLVPFVGLLGYIFESNRRKAHDRLIHALNELTVSNAKLQKVIDEKNSFLDIAAHDLKNPLSVISGYADLLCLSPDPDPVSVKQKSTEILNSANRMIEILKNLLSIRELEDQLFLYSCDKCYIKPIVDQVTSDFSLSAKAKGIEVKTQLLSKDVAFLSDPNATHQIIDNLVSNAIKYSPFNTTIRISVSEPDDENVVLSVEDEGPGLSIGDQEDLFKKFSRLSPKPTGGESSHGLGLWIVKMMANAMDGDVECSSVLGEGANFSLTLPTARNRTRISPFSRKVLHGELTLAR